MKLSRAYIASLGTTAVLIAFALLLLAVAGALLGFHGWPSGGGSDGSAAVTLDGSRLTDAAPVTLGDGVATAAAASPGDGTRARRARARRSRDRSGTAGARKDGAAGQGSAGATAAAPGSSGSGPSPASLGRHVTGALETVAPRAGKTLSEARDAVGQVIGDTGKAVSDTANGLGGQLPGKRSLQKPP